MWSPWRMAYVSAEKDHDGRGAACVFCDLPARRDDERTYILYRGARAFVIMNLYPYNNGHLMVVPYAHVDSIANLGEDVLTEMVLLIQRAQAVVEESMRPQGFNIGVNQGRAAGALPLGGDAGIAEVGRLAVEGPPRASAPGARSADDTLLPRFVDACMGFVDPTAIRGLRVVTDSANGMSGLYLPPVLERLRIEAVPYFLELDGRFPNHEPNPLLPENREFIMSKVREHRADLGIAFDGDADRCFFIDDTGEFVAGDFLTALLARHLLARSGPATVVYDLRASWAVRDAIAAAGGTPDMHRVGHAFIKRRMREVDAIFAGEVSGHYYFRDFSFADTGLVPALLVMEMVATTGRRLSEMVAEFRERYHISGEINSTVDDAPAAIQRIRERYADGAQTEIDGLSVDFDDWHFNVRSSNTEPLLRLNLESLVSEQDMERRRDEVLEVIRS
jgi:phosphomannomutase